MEIRLTTAARVYISRVIDVDTIDELRDAVFKFEGDALIDLTAKSNGDWIDLEIDECHGIDEVEIDDGCIFDYLDGYIDSANNDPEHELYHTDVDYSNDSDEQNDNTFAAESIDAVDTPHAEAATEAHITQTANTAKVIRIPQPPKITRRTGFAAVKNSLKRLFR